MVLTRRAFTTCTLVASGALAAGGCTMLAGQGAHSEFAAPGARNVVLFIIDDLNDWITALGNHPQVKAPNIASLAASGAVFLNAHAQAPICGPSRASLLSGLYPAQTGIYGQISDDQLGPAVAAVSPTLLLPQYLHANGYRTGGAGKVSHQGGQVGMFDEYLHSEHEYGPNAPERFKWHDRRTHTDWGAYPDADEDMRDYQTATWGVDFLSRQGEQPFLLALGMVRPHVPWYVPKRWLDMFPLDDIIMPSVLDHDLDDVPQAARDLAAVPQMPTLDWARDNGEWRAMVQAYLASVAFADHCVGIALNGLKASRHAENTLICLASDNGYHMGEKGRFAKMSLWDRSTRVPLIFAGPGVQTQVISDPVGLIDIYPTLIDMLGLPANTENAGRSLASLLAGKGALPVTPQLSTFGEGNHAIVDQRYRYIRYKDGSEELYDHASDPMEWHNRADDAQMATVKARLAEYLPRHSLPDVMAAKPRL